MRGARLISLMGCLWAGAVSAEARPADLDKAARLLTDQKWDAAAKTLEAASRQPGNKRETVLRILELQGVLHSQLGQDPKARVAWQSLLSMDPRHELTGKYSDKVLKSFALAQTWARANPALELAAEAAALDGNGRVMQLAAKLKADPLKLARKVRFYFRPDQLKWTEVDVDLQGVYAAAGTECDGVEWYADLLGERDAVLLTIGSRLQPFLEGAAAQYAKREPEKKPDVPVKEEPKVELTTTTAAAPVEEVPQLTAKSSGGSALKPVGYTLLGLGAVTAGIGVYFGVQAQQGRFTLQNPVLDENGVQTSPTQRETFALQDKVQRDATIANVLFLSAAAVAIAGGVCVYVGSTATVSPGAGGLVLSGSLP